jgi:hypothetical protein
MAAVPLGEDCYALIGLDKLYLQRFRCANSRHPGGAMELALVITQFNFGAALFLCVIMTAVHTNAGWCAERIRHEPNRAGEIVNGRFCSAH